MLRMGDSIDPVAIPAGLDAYAGYIGGRWPDFEAIAEAHPGTHLLSIAISAAEDADCLDIETGDATIDQAPAWAARQRARGVARPALYIAASQAADLVSAMAAADQTRPSYRLLTAHYASTLGPHICGTVAGCPYTLPADGTQWIDHGNWDESLLADDFFAVPTPTPAPPARPKGAPTMFLANDNKTQYVVTADATGELVANPIGSLAADPHPELEQLAGAIPNAGSVPALLDGIKKVSAI